MSENRTFLVVSPSIDPYEPLARIGKIVWARQPQDALEPIQQARPDLLVLAGWLDFANVADQLREPTGGPIAPVLLVCSRGRIDWERKRVGLPIAGFIVEGFTADELTSRVNEIVAGAQREMEFAERVAREKEASIQAEREKERSDWAEREKELADRAEREKERADRAEREKELAVQAEREKERADSAGREKELESRAEREKKRADKAELGKELAEKEKELAVPAKKGVGEKLPIPAAPSEASKGLADIAAVRDNFLDILVYDIRSPMASIEVGLEFLQANEKDLTVVHRKVAQKLLHSCLDIKTTLENFIDLERLELEPSSLESAAVDFRAIVKDAIEPLKKLLEVNKVALDLDMPSKLPAIDGDGKLLKRAVADLVLSAGKMAESGTPVSVRVKSDSAGITVSVENKVQTIPEDVRGKIFDRYLHRGKSGWIFPRGFATALAYCRKVIDLHGGRVWLTPVAPSGNQFHLFVPLSSK